MHRRNDLHFRLLTSEHTERGKFTVGCSSNKQNKLPVYFSNAQEAHHLCQNFENITLKLFAEGSIMSGGKLGLVPVYLRASPIFGWGS